MSEPINPALADLVEAEVKHRVARHTNQYEKQLKEERARVEAAELDTAIHRWAIAGILSRNVHVSVNIDMSQTNDPLEVIRLVAREAARELFHQAQLHFNQHAEYGDLKYQISAGRRHCHIATEPSFTANRANWPRP